jgi:hypothetical protein
MAQEIRPGVNLVANSATIVAEAFKNPLHDSVVNLDSGYLVISTEAPPGTLGLAVRRNKPAPRQLSSVYKIALFAVIALTGLALFIEIGLAIFAHEPPTGFQQSLFATADFGWKAGFGALIGFIGGKQL